MPTRDPVRKLIRRVRALLKRIQQLEQELAVERALRAAQAPLWPVAPAPVYPQQPFVPPTVEPWPGYPAPYVGDPIPNPPFITTTDGTAEVQWDDQRLSGTSLIVNPEDLA